MKKVIIIISYSLILTFATVYVLLDAFVIECDYIVIATPASTSSSIDTNAITYVSNQVQSSITLTTYREDDTTIYVADVYLASGNSIATYLAKGIYGKNVVENASVIAKEARATLAINGDYYGVRTSGYVIRNGILLRSTKRSDDQEDLAIFKNGSMSIVKEGDYTAQQLLDSGAVQVLSFGPGLVENSVNVVSDSKEVVQAKSNNPRTAIGYVSGNHYIFVVADGRTDESTGISLYELAEFMKSLGVTTAYNLDGGGSTTMVYNGKVINKPTSNGTIEERKVSDIIYVN